MRRACYLNPGRDLATAVNLARRVEALGYDSAWVTHGLGRDSFVVLAAYGAATTRLGLGNGVVPIYPRHPVAMAQAALTLSELSGGRFRLGIGVSHRASMETMLGLAVVEPLAVMREYVAVLRGALGAGVDFSGKYYRVQWSLALPTRPPAPPIHLAALGGIGSADTARAFLEAYRRSGVTLAAVRPITFPHAPWYRRTLEAAADW